MVRCDYCGTNVLVPAEYRQDVNPPPPGDISPQVSIHVIDLPSPQPQQNRVVLGVVIGGIVFIVLVSVLAALLAGGVGIFAASRGIELAEDAIREQAVLPALTPTANPSPTPVPTDTPVPFASLIAVIDGNTGEGAQMDDPRNIAVDPDGNIYIANYGAGLIYRIDSDGNLDTIVEIDPGSNMVPFISDLAVGADSRLYAARGGDILDLDVNTWEQTVVIPGGNPENYFTKVAVDPAENLYAVHYSARGQDLLRMDADGNLLWRIEDVIAQADPQANFGELGLAADPGGYGWLVNRGAYQVYQFSPTGSLVHKFGSQGNDPGELWSPDQIAVKTGLVFILDGTDIEVFSERGDYNYSIPVGTAYGTPRDIALDPWENIYVITSKNQILKYHQNIVVRMIE
jgi:hypothetical protein